MPPTLSLGALLTEAAALLRQALDGIGSAELRELAADPVRGLATLAHALGVDWPGSIDEVVAFARSRLDG